MCSKHGKHFCRQLPERVMRVSRVEYKDEISIILGLGKVKTLSGPCAAARTDMGAERRGLNRLSLSFNSTRQAHNSFRLLPSAYLIG